MMTGTICKEQAENQLKLELPATFESIDLAEQATVEFLEEKNVHADLFGIRIILREALLNAVIHGSSKDSEKLVQYVLDISDGDEVKLEICDSGPGFAREGKLGRIETLSDGGRGLNIMEIYSDEMIFNEQGNHLTLVKYIDSHN